jgi:hypothetical protein
MNWSCAMVGGIILFATVYYVIWGRKTYSPPKETIEDYIQRYQATGPSPSLEKDVSGEVVEER